MGGGTLKGALLIAAVDSHQSLAIASRAVVDLQWNAIQNDYGCVGVCFVTHNDLFVCRYYAEIGGERATKCH